MFERFLTKYYVTIQYITRQKSIKLHEITLLRVLFNRYYITMHYAYKLKT